MISEPGMHYCYAVTRGWEGCCACGSEHSVILGLCGLPTEQHGPAGLDEPGGGTQMQFTGSGS